MQGYNLQNCLSKPTREARNKLGYPLHRSQQPKLTTHHRLLTPAIHETKPPGRKKNHRRIRCMRTCLNYRRKGSNKQASELLCLNKRAKRCMSANCHTKKIGWDIRLTLQRQRNAPPTPLHSTTSGSGGGDDTRMALIVPRRMVLALGLGPRAHSSFSSIVSVRDSRPHI